MNLRKIVSVLVAAFLGIFLFAAILDSWETITPGNVGVVFNKWTGGLRTAPQGIVWTTPFCVTVESYPVALRTYTMVARDNEGSSRGDDSIDLPTLEGQHIKQDISVTYNTTEEKAVEVFRAFKGAKISEIENSFIRRTIITTAQNVAGQMSLTEVISSKRDELQTKIQKALSVELLKMGFTLDKVNLGASHLPPTLEQQMQQKMAAQQEAQQAEYALQKSKALARAAVAEAQGQADSRVLKAKAEAEANRLMQQTLTANLIEYEKIKRWDGVLPIVASGNAIVSLDLKKAAVAAAKEKE